MGGIPYRLEEIDDFVPARGKQGFVEGEQYSLYLDDPSQLGQSVLGYSIFCARYESHEGAATWVSLMRETLKTDTLNGVTRDEPLEGIGHESYLMVGLLDASSSDAIFNVAVVFMRVHNVACIYQGLDEFVQPTDPLVAIVTSVSERAMLPAG